MDEQLKIIAEILVAIPVFINRGPRNLAYANWTESAARS
jgi:hypothetical protein